MDPTSQKPAAWRTFRFLRRIGKGGFGEVYLAEMSTGGGFAKPVAVKVLREDYLEDEEVLRRLRDEGRLLGQLSHPSIVTASDLVTLARRLSVVMEYVPGANLNWIINPRVLSSTIPPTVCCAIISRVAEALDAAWSRPSTLSGEPLRVLHRDIKPSNIRVTPDGVVKVLDFGVARAEFQERETDTQDLRMGSMPYMAPEVLLDLPHTPATDIYSLGVTLYELTARRRFGKCKLQRAMHEALVAERFSASNLSHFSLASEDLEELIRQMVAFDQAHRPTAQEVVARCRELERRTVGPRLNEWAPHVIPSVVRSVNVEDTEGALVGQTLSEDATTAGRALRGESALVAGEVLLEGPRSTSDSFAEDPSTEDTAPVGLGVPPPPLEEEAATSSLGRWIGLAVVLGVLLVGGIGLLGQPPSEPVLEVTTSVQPEIPAIREASEPPQLVEPEEPEESKPAPRAESTRTVAPRTRARPPRKEERSARSPRVEAPVAEEPVAEEPAVEAGTAEEPAGEEAAPGTSAETAAEEEPAPRPTGPPQEIAISSKPMGIAVSVDGVYRGTTPLRVSLREGPHRVAFEGPEGTRYKTLVVKEGERSVVVYDVAQDSIR